MLEKSSCCLPDFIVQSLINKAKEMPVVREGDLLSLIDFGNDVGNLVSTMKFLKSEGHLSNPELRQQLLFKLPYSSSCGGESILAEEQNVQTHLRKFAQLLESRANAARLVVYQKGGWTSNKSGGKK